MRFKIGTRGSLLARTQSGWVRDRLAAAHPEHSFELEIITTTGDRVSASSDTKAFQEAGGTKGLFVKEIEEALLDGRVQFAVHSGKDMPAASPQGLVVAAFPEREDPRDVLIFGDPKASLQDPPRGLRVGTSSPRRGLQVRALAPGVEVVDLRGNVDTRIRRMREGRCDATVLAAAGLNRLGLGAGLNLAPIDARLMIPAPAQGALALQTRAGGEAETLARALDHAATRAAVELETRFMRRLGGGCNQPLGAYAESGPAGWTVHLFYSDLEGASMRRETLSAGDAADAARKIDAYSDTLGAA